MQISSATTTIPFTFNRVSSQSFSFADETEGSSSMDKAVLNMDATQFTALVADAKSMPEVRDDVVDSFKTRISNGEYPSAHVMSGLTDVLSGVIAQRANED